MITGIGLVHNKPAFNIFNSFSFGFKRDAGDLLE